MQKWLLKLRLLFFRKPKFRTWAILEDKKFEVIRAVEQISLDFPIAVWDYISAALFTSPEKISDIYWKDVVDAFIKIHSVTVPDKVLPLISKQSEKKNDKDPWDYSGRLWFFYSSIIAAAFGWNDEKISDLPVDDALAYIQEILTERQLEREFKWSMAEVAYRYDKFTKKSSLSPLHRPYWMLVEFGKKEDVKKIKIPKSLLPMGTIIKIDDETKEVEPSRNNENLLAS